MAMEIKTNANNKIMDLDLAEYDQVDEFKLIMDNQNQLYCDNSKFLVTLSSCSDQASIDDTNCENDFVFLPAPLQQQQQQQQNQTHKPPPLQTVLTKSQDPTTTPATAQAQDIGEKQNTRRGLEITETGSNENTVNKTIQYPLIALNNNGINPFGNYQQQNRQTSEMEIQHPINNDNNNTQIFNKRPVEGSYALSTKPFGVIEQPETSHLVSSANKLADLMQQIVAKSDLIYIAIPCAYCPYNETVACPPSDISNWINHMSFQHNCKICPICNKLVGLGPDRDIDVMRKHVIEHLNMEWLDKRASRINFTFGLQQRWFSGSRCAIKDPRHR